MESQISEISPVFVEVSVQVPWPDVEKALEGSYSRLGKTARVKGFRPGKVPKQVLKQVFGDRVKHEVVSNLVERGLGLAVQKHELAVVAVPPMSELPELKSGESLSFKAKVEVRPKIEKLDLSGIELTRASSAVAEEAVDEALEHLRQRHGELAVPEPMRGAQDGDVLTCDYVVTIDGAVQEDLGATERPIELGPQLLPELKAALLGKQPGDKAEAEVPFPDGAGDELKGKTGHFSLEVKDLKHKALPALDDEFAKDVDHESLADLRQKTRERLENEAKDSAEGALREQVIEKLLEKNPIEPPPSLVAQQHQAMLQEYLRVMQMTGQQLPFGEQLFESARADAERRVRAGLLLGALAQQAEIQVEASDVDKRLDEIAGRTGKHVAKIRAELSREQRQSLESQVLEEKLLEYLLAQATIIEAGS